MTFRSDRGQVAVDVEQVIVGVATLVGVVNVVHGCDGSRWRVPTEEGANGGDGIQLVMVGERAKSEPIDRRVSKV